MSWDEDLNWLVLVPVVAALAFVYGHQIRRRLVQRAGQVRLVQDLLATFSLEKRLFKQLLMVLGIAAAAAATMRPQFGVIPEAVRPSGIDVAVAFDISKSMLARDVQPSRLGAAQALLKQLLDQLVGHRVALVPFAGIAFTQSPLTADKSAIRLYLDSLDPRVMPVGGTNLAMAIEEGLRLLTSREDRGDRASRSQVILLVTDGEDMADAQGEAAKAAAKKAGEAGVRIYAVAVGTRLGEPIPLLNDDGTHAGYQRDSNGKPIYSKLNLPMLEELARLAAPEDPDTRRVFLLDGATAVPTEIAHAFDSLQKATLEGNVKQKRGQKFQYVLVFAVFLLLFDVFVGERRRRKEAA